MSSRDRRFVAIHRGGPLARESHAALARWAADCAGRVLPMFARHSEDRRPAKALEVLRAWAAGDVTTGTAMKASLAAHAAARKASDPAAVAAARAAGQAAGTAHCADHCIGALLYALKAMAAAGRDIEIEFRRRIAKVPAHLREQVAEGIVARLGKLQIRGVEARSSGQWSAKASLGRRRSAQPTRAKRTKAVGGSKIGTA